MGKIIDNGVSIQGTKKDIKEYIEEELKEVCKRYYENEIDYHELNWTTDSIDTLFKSNEWYEAYDNDYITVSYNNVFEDLHIEEIEEREERIPSF